VGFRAPAERITLPVAVVIYAGAAVLHAVRAPALVVLLAGGVAAPGVTYGVVLHRTRRHNVARDRDVSAWLAARASGGVAMAGVWAAAATWQGVNAGPWAMTTVAYFTLAVASWAFVAAADFGSVHEEPEVLVALGGQLPYEGRWFDGQPDDGRQDCDLEQVPGARP
jgi:hypothetical protein